MGRGTKRLRGSESQAQDEPKYDGNKRGYQKWKSLANQECLGNATWESLQCKPEWGDGMTSD